MSVVKPWSLGCCDEELTSVSVFSSICHWQTEWFVLKLEVFVSKSFTPNRSSSGSVSTCEVSTLDHEAWNDSVEFAALECEFKSVTFKISFAQSNEIFDSLGDSITKHIYDNVSSVLSININWKGDSVGWCFLNSIEILLFRDHRKRLLQ